MADKGENSCSDLRLSFMFFLKNLVSFLIILIRNTRLDGCTDSIFKGYR